MLWYAQQYVNKCEFKAYNTNVKRWNTLQTDYVHKTTLEASTCEGFVVWVVSYV